MKRKIQPNNDRIDSGFVNLGDFLKRQFNSTTLKKKLATKSLLTTWPEIVGETYASISEPVKVNFNAKKGEVTLILLATGSYAEQVRLSTPDIIERVNDSFGYEAIHHIRVTQSWKGQRASTQEERKLMKTLETKPAEYIYPNTLGKFHDQSLEDNLIALGNLIYSRAEANDKDRK